MTWMLLNSEGKPDGVLTLAVLSVLTILGKVLLAGVVIKGFAFGASPTADIIGALLAPTLGAYVARRYTDAKYPNAPIESSPPTDKK